MKISDVKIVSTNKHYCFKVNKNTNIVRGNIIYNPNGIVTTDLRADEELIDKDTIEEIESELLIRNITYDLTNLEEYHITSRQWHYINDDDPRNIRVSMRHIEYLNMLSDRTDYNGVALGLMILSYFMSIDPPIINEGDRKYIYLQEYTTDFESILSSFGAIREDRIIDNNIPLAAPDANKIVRVTESNQVVIPEIEKKTIVKVSIIKKFVIWLIKLLMKLNNKLK